MAAIKSRYVFTKENITLRKKTPHHNIKIFGPDLVIMVNG